MMIVPPVVLTTTQLVGGLLASAKNALELTKASQDHQLKMAVGELYDSLLDVKARVLDLDEEIRSLKAEIARKDEVVGPSGPHGYFFLKDKPEQPICPKCFQSKPSNNVFLSDVTDLAFSSARGRYCIICGETFTEARKSSQVGPRITLRMS